MFRSIESLMLAEFAADAAVLWVALRTKHRIRPFRLFTASAVGAAVTAFASMFLHTKAAYLVSAAAAMPVMLIICTGGIRFSELLSMSASMVIISALMAGAANFFGGFGFISMISALLVGWTVISMQRRWLNTWEVEIELEAFGGYESLNALIDTGNRLSEPMSGLPVIVTEESSLRRLLPQDFSSTEGLPYGVRRIAYGGVGGDGTLICFMPDTIRVNGRTAGDIWVAVYPGRLPGQFSALAPPALMEVIDNN